MNPYYFGFSTTAFLLILCIPVLAAEPPHLLVEAPLTLSPMASRVQSIDKARLQTVMNLVGVEQPGNPLRVIIAPEESDWARQAPSWASGYAISEHDLIVLLPERVIGYPYDSFESLFEHELTHILIGRASGGQSVPRWFDEGLAMVAAHTWEFDDQAQLIWAILTNERVSPARLNTLFHQDADSSHRAYLLSHAFVRFLIGQYGNRWPKQLLAACSQGNSFHTAFVHTTSHSLAQAADLFWAQQTSWSRWIPVATSSSVLWISIIVLALYAFKKQRQRAEAVKERWKHEDE